MRYALIALLLMLGVPTVSSAQIRIGISIGAYPRFDVVPGYPVYYATDIQSNYFFFDGLYWIYQDDNWYSSSWYDGPWDAIDPFHVPVYLLQVPVRYYHRPPAYFVGWQADRAPRWGEHWGHGWDQRRSGWDRPRERLAPAPLPDYQRQFHGASYPKADQQRALRDQNYRYRPQATGGQRDDAQRAVPRREPQRTVPPSAQQPMQRPQQQRQPEARRVAPQPQQGAPATREQRQPAARQEGRDKQRGRDDNHHPDENRHQDR